MWVGHKRGVASAPPYRSSELRTFMLLLYFIVVLSYVVNRFSIVRCLCNHLFYILLLYYLML